ncbi:6023_t:CDS:2 [Funneliformis caledonium]|uniref:6023_t:CDS:1 n=1 Tax=Funneliformis caledonium TaxID=1117310 RepID=A0A9N9GQ72_9GLOM|nr:6023_t:CDS:2 [Funneliformis caledonium]
MLKKKRKADEVVDVKRILKVIVGLLKDRVSASDKPVSKKRHVEEKIKIKIQK